MHVDPSKKAVLLLAAGAFAAQACLLDSSGRGTATNGAGAAPSSSAGGTMSAGGSTGTETSGGATTSSSGGSGGQGGSGGAGGPAADTCPGTPVSIAGGTVLILDGSTTGANDDYGSPLCGGGSGVDVVYAVTAETKGILVATIESAAGTPFLSLRSNCTDAKSEIGCGESGVKAPVEKGTLIHVIVDEHPPSSPGPFKLTLQLTTCGNGILDAGEECDDGNLAGGDFCGKDCKVVCDANGSMAANFETHVDASTHHCYLLAFDPNLTWADAEADCQKWGGTLAVLSTQKEIDSLLPKLGKSGEDLWIGGDDMVRDGKFEWVDGEAWTFTNGMPPWHKNAAGMSEPNGNTVENCVETFPDGTLNDEKCNTTQNYVCERAPAGDPPPP